MASGRNAKLLRRGMALAVAAASLCLPMHGAAGREAMTGSVSCSAKAADWNYCRKSETPMSCTLRCVESGGQYVLVTREQSIVLQDDAWALRGLAGARATIHGTRENGIFKVTGAEKARH